MSSKTRLCKYCNDEQPIGKKLYCENCNKLRKQQKNKRESMQRSGKTEEEIEKALEEMEKKHFKELKKNPTIPEPDKLTEPPEEVIEAAPEPTKPMERIKLPLTPEPPEKVVKNTIEEILLRLFDKFLTPEQVMNELSCSRSTYQNLVKSKRLKTYKLNEGKNSKVYCKKSELYNLFE